MKKLKKLLKFLKKNKYLFVAAVIFLFDLYLRTLNLDTKTPFGYDQVDNAWAAKNIVVNHWFPLIGMVAKANSGIYIGPAYYYFISVFYWIFNLNPVASQMVAVVTSIFTYFVLFYIVKKLFNVQVAIIAVILNTFSPNILIFEGVQWPVQFFPIISLIIFYFLYKVTLGEVKKLIPLAFVIGIAFNLHFTAIFFPIIVLLSLPLFPRTKETLKYILFAFPFFIVWLIPNIIYSFVNKTSNSTTTSYLSTYYHGFHLRRMFQIVGDALIQFDPYLSWDKLKPFKIILFPLFFIFYFLKPVTSETKKFLYLVFLWFIVPWLIFTVYSGEISDYYFIVNRFLVLIMLSYFVYLIWNTRFILLKAAAVLIIGIYVVYGLQVYLPYKDDGSFSKHEERAKQAVDSGKRIEFQVGVPESYLYYYYMRQKGITVYESKNK